MVNFQWSHDATVQFLKSIRLSDGSGFSDVEKLVQEYEWFMTIPAGIAKFWDIERGDTDTLLPDTEYYSWASQYFGEIGWECHAINVGHTIWTRGEEERNGNHLTEFIWDGKEWSVRLSNNAIVNIMDLEKPEPIFHGRLDGTEDQPIHVGQRLLGVRKNVYPWAIEPILIAEGAERLPENFECFTDMTGAQTYLDFNQPVYSKHELEARRNVPTMKNPPPPPSGKKSKK